MALLERRALLHHLAEHLHLLRRDPAEGELHADHLHVGLALAVDALFEPEADIPIVGASGAVAGVMGAYVVLYPHGRVLTLVPIFFFPLFLRFPSFLFLGVWFLSQFISGLVSRVNQTSPIAWWAHVGGFLAGMILIYFFMQPDRCRYCYNPNTKDYDPEDPFKRS